MDWHLDDEGQYYAYNDYDDHNFEMILKMINQPYDQVQSRKSETGLLAQRYLSTPKALCIVCCVSVKGKLDEK